MTKEESIEVAKNLVSTQFGSIIPYKIDSGTKYMYETNPPKEIEANLVEISGSYVGFGKEDNTIILKENTSEVTLMIVNETTYSRSILEERKIKFGEKLYVLAIKVDEFPLYIPIIILDDDEKSTFSMIKSLYGRIDAIKEFYNLDEAKQKSIIDQQKTKSYKRFNSFDNVIFETKREQMLKYALTKETYPVETQRVIEAMFGEINPSKHKVGQRLAYIFKILPINRYSDPVTPETFNELFQRFYKMDRQKQLIKDIFAAKERAEKKGCKLLFVGSSGVGKSAFMKAIADALNRPYESIPLRGLSCPWELDGLSPGFESGDAGAFIKAYASNNTSHMTIGLEDLDKMTRNSKEGDPMMVFYKLFSGELYDRFLQCNIKTDNTVFIATANSIEGIPKDLLNMFDAIIYFDDYSSADKFEIVKHYIIPATLKSYNISNMRFEDDAIRYIITNYCDDYGVNSLQNNIERIVNRVIATDMADKSIIITIEYIEKVLHELVQKSRALYFIRNRDAYSEPVAKEIKKCLEKIKKTTTYEEEQFVKHNMLQRLDYLLACRKEETSCFDNFNPKSLRDMLHKNLYGMENVIKEVTNFYYTESIQGNRLNGNLALCGGVGIGKTTIVKNIADALGYNHVKISLNGIQDIKVLRGFARTYQGSEPGCIVKGIKGAGSSRFVLQLDELDKLKADYAVAIIDLLDREWTDDFLGVPIDLSQVIVIATANDWGNVPAVLRDRFIVVNVDGYTHNEKMKIVSDYVVPKLEKCYASSKVSITIDEEANKELLKTYCNSFGVRDAEKALQRICSSKLMDQIGEEDPMIVHICKDDLSKYLGAAPIRRGNFPDYETVSGVSKALAVSNDNTGSVFAIETVLLEGPEAIEMTGLPKESASDSAKIAVTCIKRKYPELLKNKEIHLHFGEGSISKEGPSAGLALFMSILSAALEKPILYKKPYDIAFTGEISLYGGIFAVGGIMEKIQAACDSGCKKVFIPMQNFDRIEKEKLVEFDGCQIIPVSNVDQVVEEIFPKLK